MNPVLEQIYSLVVPSAPYIIVAYALIWVALFGYVFFVSLRLGRIETQMSVLEDTMARRDKTAGAVKAAAEADDAESAS